MDMEAVQPDFPLDLVSDVEPGIPFAMGGKSSVQDKDRPLYIFTKDRKLVKINQLKVEGDKTKGAYVAALKARAIEPLSKEQTSDGIPVSKFHAPLQ